MRKFKFFLFLFLPAFLMSVIPAEKDKATINLTGIWEETWGNPTGEESEIYYHDQYRIKHKGDNISMSCPKMKEYSFAHIHLTDNNFTFQLTNESDPKDLYIMAYNLYLNDAGDLMKGTVVTNKGVEEKVELKRIR